VGIMEKQREEQNKKPFMQVENKEKSKMKVIIIQEITKEVEKALQKETEISWKNDTYLFEKMEKWSLKPKKLK
jgi:hypothetical protein